MQDRWTIKNVIFWKVTARHVIVNTPSGLADAAKKLIPSIFMVYMPLANYMISETHGMESVPSMREHLKIHKIVRMFDNDQPYLRFF